MKSTQSPLSSPFDADGAGVGLDVPSSGAPFVGLFVGNLRELDGFLVGASDGLAVKGMSGMSVVVGEDGTCDGWDMVTGVDFGLKKETSVRPRTAFLGS